VSARPEVLLRGDDRVRAQLSTFGSVAAGLEDRDRMPDVLTRVVASIPRRLHLRLFVVASHCSFTPSTVRRLPRVRLTDPVQNGQYHVDGRRTLLCLSPFPFPFSRPNPLSVRVSASSVENRFGSIAVLAVSSAREEFVRLDALCRVRSCVLSPDRRDRERSRESVHTFGDEIQTCWYHRFRSLNSYASSRSLHGLQSPSSPAESLFHMPRQPNAVLKLDFFFFD